MADEAGATAPAADAKPVEEQTRSKEAPAASEAADAPSTDDAAAAPADAPLEEQAPKTAQAVDEQKAVDGVTDVPAETDTTATNGDAAVGAEASANDDLSASAKKAGNNRRKSTGGVPEHKLKKTPSKKKAAPELHLDTQPGDLWYMAMKGYPPWPIIICDEDMLPDSLIKQRPVSAKRIDGTYREDFREGGKNAKDRKYPIMFLGTNEFAWAVNTQLSTLDMDELKTEVEAGNTTKKNKALWDAYVIASENNNLDHFKTMLKAHDDALREDQLAREAKAEEKAQKAKKASKRKSTAAEDSDDVDMEDAGDDAAPSAKKAKASKKRKKDDDSDGETGKSAKTPKLKLNNKPKDTATPKSEKKSKKKAKASEDEAESTPAEAPPMTEAERLEKREKSVLYLRHRLQKGFISRDIAPKDDDMPHMSEYLRQLEDLKDLEGEIIKGTKVHKVLKAIVKLEHVPREEEFKFKDRSAALLNKWAAALNADPEATPAEAAKTEAPVTNGTKEEAAKTNGAEGTEETRAALETTKLSEADGDVTMADAKEEAKDKTAAAKTEDKAEDKAEEKLADAPVEAVAA